MIEQLVGLVKQFPEGSFVLIFLVLCLMYCLFYGIFVTLPKTIMRHRTLHKHGYPPSHCDIDGKFKSKKENENEEDGVTFKIG